MSPQFRLIFSIEVLFMSKKAIAITCIVTLILIVPVFIIILTGWGARPHTADKSLKKLNPELDYSVYYYNIPLGSDAEPFRNLSGTGCEEESGLSRFASGWNILQNTDDLAALDAAIQTASANKNHANVIQETDGTTDAVYDADFFAENALLLVDLCAENSVTMYFYPQNLKIDGNTVSLNVRWDRDNATTAGCAGQYCLITIPKGCTNVDISLRN